MSTPDSKRIEVQAGRIIASGGVIAFRTDTFYGLGANPLNAQAVSRIVELKGREEGKPILILISDLELVSNYVTHTSEHFNALSKRFWPGPLTLIGIARETLPEELTAGTGTVGIRLPADEEVRALVRECGGALTATSANPSGALPARAAQDVENYFPTGIDLIVDGGDVTVTKPSTVVDLSRQVPLVIREGAIKRSQLTDFGLWKLDAGPKG